MKPINQLSRKSQATLKRVMQKPVSGTIRWKSIEAMLVEMGAKIEEREGSRINVVFMDLKEARIFHRPHPSPDTDKGAVAALAKWMRPLLKEDEDAQHHDD